MDLIFIFLFFIIPYNDFPDWESNYGFYSTGGGFCDIDNDGYLDFVVSNGNDMEREENVIYFNNGGALEIFPSWSSVNHEYSGHLVINDLNNDGFFDFAVSNYIGIDGFSSPGDVIIYRNLNGVPENSPSWRSADSTYNFSCDFGDIDGDGYAELAIAGGERYSQKKEKIKIYKNDQGNISPLPYWISEYEYFAYDVLFYDINRDGWLDLVIACDGERNLIFYNNSGTLETSPSWLSHDGQSSIQVDVGDLDNNGYPDLVFANNGQLYPYVSNLNIYLNYTGVPETIPSFTLDENKDYYSTVSLCDIDYDGDLDIGAGGWWEPLVIFENFSGFFNTTPDWSFYPSNGTLVCEKVTFAEIDELWFYKADTFIRGNNEPIYTFKLRNLCKIEQVMKIDSGTNYILPINYYTYSLESGWISINKDITQDIDTFVIGYFYPSSYDLTITNWDESTGNFYFLYNLPGVKEFSKSKFKDKRECFIIRYDKSEIVIDISGRKKKIRFFGIGFINREEGIRKIIVFR